MLPSVVKYTTIQLILSLVVTYKWPLHQLDVNNAFLEGQLEETVFMQQPQGLINPTYPNHVCRLHKPIYGLRVRACSFYVLVDFEEFILTHPSLIITHPLP